MLSHRCWNRQIFGGAKDFCPNYPKIARKIFGLHFMRFSYEFGRHFFKSKHVGRHFCSYFYGVFIDFSENFRRFSQSFCIFPLILSGFSPNQNVWGWACTSCTPASHTTGLAYKNTSCGCGVSKLMKCLFKSLGQKSNVRKCPSVCLEIRVFTYLLLWQLCPSSHTFLARQSQFRQPSQKSFEQRKEMTFDCEPANIRAVVVRGWYCPSSQNLIKSFGWNHGE